jgi:hypothetical protein
MKNIHKKVKRNEIRFSAREDTRELVEDDSFSPSLTLNSVYACPQCAPPTVRFLFWRDTGLIFSVPKLPY